MAVHFTFEIVKCWSCGYKERLLDFVGEWENLPYIGARELINSCDEEGVDVSMLDDFVVAPVITTIDLPVGYTSIMDGDGLLAMRARKYLTGRGFSLDVLDKLNIGYSITHTDNPKDDYFGYIIIPFMVKCRMEYYIGRDFIGNPMRYKNPEKSTTGVGKNDLLFNEDALELRTECFVAEGWTDALTMGDNGVSTQGWELSPTQRSKMLKCKKCRRFVFLPDKGFFTQAIQTAMLFLDHKEVVVVSLEYEEGGKDANAIGKDHMLELYHHTEPLTYSKAINLLT